MQVTVALCTHNPREDYLRRVLQALEQQTLAHAEWELLLIDNASREPLSSRFDLSWHPNARHVREEELGLTPARLRGIQEARGDLIVFVDDDNVLHPHYLATTQSLMKQWACLGVIGGSIQAEFEKPPSPRQIRYLRYLAISEIEQPCWSNLLYWSDAVPIGAGLCVRKSVALAYAKATQTDPLRRLLDRKGSNFSSAGDLDIAFTATDVGLGYGRFPELKLTHLIGERRVQDAYLSSLVAGRSASAVLLDWVRGKRNPAARFSLLRTLRMGVEFCLGNALDRSVLWKTHREEQRVRQLIQTAS